MKLDTEYFGFSMTSFNFPQTQSFQPHGGPVVDSASKSVLSNVLMYSGTIH
jgi:hypothetical protein